MPRKEYDPTSNGKKKEVVLSVKDAMSREIAMFVQDKYQDAATHRRTHETRWLQAFDQFRGRYNAEEIESLSRLLKQNPYASRAFIKITKTKTLAGIGSLYEVITAGGRIPIGVEETPEPEGIAKKVYVELDKQSDTAVAIDDTASAIGFPGDGKDIPRGTTFKDLMGGLGTSYRRLFKDGTLLTKGDSPDPVNAIEIHPAKLSAEKMNNWIQDQLTEADAIKKFEGLIWESCVFGTGVLKGPFTYQEELPKWEMDEETGKLSYKPRRKLRPYLYQPTLWNIYPDPHCERPDELEYVIERHKMSSSKLSKLKKQPNFKSDQIDIALTQNSTGNVEQDWELRLKDSGLGMTNDGRYEVLEYWGSVSQEQASEWGLEGVDTDADSVAVCLWIVNNACIKAVVNPFTPERIPYFFMRYEEHPYQIWGIGIPENMQDAQGMINVHTRAAQDNLRLAGSCMLEVNETTLAPGQDNSIYAGKVWRKQGGAPGQAVYSISFNNTAPAHLQFISAANQWADQSSGIPSVMHGQTGVSGTGRTAFGLSAIMNSGNLAIRTVVKNMDKDILKPLGQALFNWNMQFNTDANDIRGDLKIVAKGLAALSMKEVQSQRLLSLLQIGANPLVAPFINVPNILHDLAVSLDLDPSDVINDVDTAKLYAEIIGQQANVNFGTSQESQGNPAQGGSQGGGTVGSTDEANNNAGAGGGNIGDAVGTGAGKTAIT